MSEKLILNPDQDNITFQEGDKETEQIYWVSQAETSGILLC